MLILNKNIGLFYTLISVLCASLMVIVVRLLSETVNIQSILFYRGFFGFILVVLFLFKINKQQLRTKRIHIHFVRSVINAFALFFWFSALSTSTLSEVAAIGNTAPIFATLLAIIFLKEKIFLSRLFAIILGFAGVLVIMQPGFTDISTGYYYALLASILWGMLVVFLKDLSKTENFFAVIFYFQLSLFLFFGLFFFNKIELLNQKEFLWILLIAIFGNLSQLFYFQALKYKDVSFVTPFEYLRFVLITFLAVIFFSEKPHLTTYLGSLIIFIGIIIISLDKKIIAKRFDFTFKN